MDGLLLLAVLEKHRNEFHPVILSLKPFEKIDLSKNNSAFHHNIYNDLSAFTTYINHLRSNKNDVFLQGGYLEQRDMYESSNIFESDSIRRDIHLGIDIWGNEGTKIFAPLGGMVHSFAFNSSKGDYGATIILQHQLETLNFYTLYGHLCLADIQNLRKGQFISRGENFGHFGNPDENGNWPPHLHFQMIIDLGNSEGDYPGVCSSKEIEKFKSNCPNPSVLLNI